MHYLIDGHNLIGKMPDIDLRDPDDEIQLVLRLKSWIAEQKNREATVIFDGGQTGGVSNRLSSRDLTVIFSPPGQIADTLIIRRLKSLKNPRQYTVVSSDRMVSDAAKAVRVKSLKSEEFIAREGFVYEDVDEATPAKKHQKTPKTPPKPEDPLLSEAEVSEWLQLFGPVPERKARPLQALKGEPSPKKKKKKKPKPRTGQAFQQLAESENPELNKSEISEWLALFGPSPTSKTEKKSINTSKRKKKKKTSLTDAKRGDSKLSDEDLADWLAYFGEDM